MSAKVKVAVRVRPMNKRERDMNALCVVDMDNNQTVLTSVDKRKSSKTFAFDHCFWTMDPNNPKYADQEQVFQALGIDILDNSFEGYNACIFAYGQTGSGKSYTMMGSLGDETTKGIIPRLCDTLFDKIAQKEKPRISFKVEVSYMEIYCEKVKDLLCLKGSKSSLKVREHKSLGPYVENLSKLAVRSFKDINDLMSEGNKSRTVAATQMNTESSRSHAVFSIVLTQTEFDPASQSGTEKVSKISLVDLAGSERVSKTGALGERLKEGSLINKSLTTLGLVISALADISAGKKPKNAYIPYRDSTLTWLLKDNLGGNSKTVMVATVSPASDNFEETLSTLRYADRAKRIVNHAVINEDPNSRVIRELREEVEKLRGLIGGGGGGGGGSGVNTKEISELQERLKISEGLMTEMSKSWEQKLAETERIHHERQKALEDMGISVQEAGIGVQVDKYYMVNLNADPSLNELLVCYLKPLTRVGRAQAQTPQDIVLRGLGIANEHCTVEIQDRDVFITPLRGARTLVNGVPVSERVQVRHGGRILLGNNHLYRLSCPYRSDAGQSEEENSELMDYEQAMKEISINELTNDPVYSKVQENLTKKHEEEKEGALAAQREKYEEQLAKLKEQLETSNASSPTPPKQKYTTMEEEWEEKNRERLIKSVLQANRLVQEANMLAEALRKDTVFKVTLTVPRSYLSPTQHVESQDTTNEVAIRVLHKQRGTDSVWTTDTLEEKVLTMREMYERMEEGGSLLDEAIGPDPFYDLEQHALLGVANFYLECLNHDDIVHDYFAPIVAPTGKVCGKLRVAIQRLPTVMGCGREDDVDIPEIYVPDDSIDIGSRIPIQVSVLEASGLPKEYSHYVFCQYQFWKEEGPMIIPPLVQVSHEKVSEKVQRFEHVQVFNVEVTEDFLDFLEEGALAVEVWGHRRSGFNELMAAPASDEVEALRHKSFPERWNELIKHMELVVEMMELNEQGEYVAVEIQSKPDVNTGGVFMIRQGQSRRINVTVKQLEGSGASPLTVDHISVVSVGSMYLRNRYDEALDSFQKDDLQRLRTKWSNALMNRREYLDAEVRKMMDKRDQSVSDLEKQNELLDQWAMLQWQRAAVLQPKPGSGVPGAVNNWNLPAGFEQFIPVLFLDLTDELVPVDEDTEGTVEAGELFGEKPDTMINLPVINSEKTMGSCSATASWDSTVHNANSLNKITGNNDRVYGIIMVGVVMQHPPGLEITLRKRICLRVYKKMGFGATLMRAFAGKENRSTCGVLYEVVTGIPKSEGMDPPPKIPANPSFVELDEDENAVEKFKTAMTSVSSILHLDKLKQDVALKEKLTISGKSLRKRITIGEATPQSLSRADSGILYPGGSQGDSPTPNDTRTTTSEDVCNNSGGGSCLTERRRGVGTEECTTVGGKVELTSSVTEGHHRTQMVEEALGVGVETGTRLGVILEDSTSQMGVAGVMGVQQQQQFEGEEDEEAKAAPVVLVISPERGQNPETGQSEVEQEESASELQQETTTDDLETQQQQTTTAADITKEVGTEEISDNQRLDRVALEQEVLMDQQEGTGEERQNESEEMEQRVETEQTEEEHGSQQEKEEVLENKMEDLSQQKQELKDVEQQARQESEVAALEESSSDRQPVASNTEAVMTSSVQTESSLIPLSQVPEVVKTDEDPEGTTTEVIAGPDSPQQQVSQSTSSTPRSSSPTPSTSSESSSVAEATSSRARKPSPPPCSLNEKVMVEIAGGFKMGTVKFIGETEFAVGEWIGVALDKPSGKHNGSVKGVKYFKCRDKHGVFVKRDKILHQPCASPSSLTSKPPSPLTKQRRVTSNPQLGKPYTGRRTSYGPRR